MFINLKEAGQTDVNNGSGIGVQPGDASVISGIHFGDPSDPQSVDQNSTGSQMINGKVSRIRFADCENLGTVPDNNPSPDEV
ncbi:hypothetical protein PNOK_0897900 [Pyrrhoderma noxium]|uniref:Uncharacterized protein n=1 Tax=Pyrrhoderma noxium TaxID=2282107 RepID=A0A286U6L9_9AGAM|nr:hypothetical protein PNOK_0897900 [Pyrrhoderma noxium]